MASNSASPLLYSCTESKSPHYHHNFTERMQRDTCYCCKKQGHWAKDCPLKSPFKPSSSTTTTTTTFIHDSDTPPPYPCPCGGGLCFVRVSRTSSNPGRKFYTCPTPNPMKCDFFKWCDLVSLEQINLSPKVTYPMCPCGAGPCLKHTEKEGPNAGRVFFGCAVERDFGACGYIQWEDIQADPAGHGDDNSSYNISPQSKRNTSNQFFDNFNKNNSTIKYDSSSESQQSMSFESPVVDIPPDSPGLGSVHVSSQNDRIFKMESPKVDEPSDLWSLNLEEEIAMEQIESPLIRKSSGGLGLMSKTTISSRQKRFINQLYAGTNDWIEDAEKLNLKHCYLGWLGRLLFPPAHCLVDPPVKPIFCCVYPTFNPIEVPRDVVLFDSEKPVLAECNLKDKTPQQDSQGFSDALVETKKRTPSVMHNDVLKILQKTRNYFSDQVVALLSSMDPLDQDNMTCAARDISTIMRGLFLDRELFAERLNGFFQSASEVAKTEQSTMQDVSSLQELTEQYIAETNEYHDISRKHAEALAAFTASDRKLKWLCEETSRVKNIAALLETQMVCCEAETSELEYRVNEISTDLLKSEKRMQAASRRVAEASKLYERKDAERVNAKAAFEKILGTQSEVWELQEKKRRKL